MEFLPAAKIRGESLGYHYEFIVLSSELYSQIVSKSDHYKYGEIQFARLQTNVKHTYIGEGETK